MANTPRTETYPRDQRGYQSGPDLITALRVIGAAIELSMLAAQDWFTLGQASTCSLQVTRKYLAGVHARIERLANARTSIRVINVSNGKNDLVFNGERAEREFEMGPGDYFAIGDSRFYALNEEMRLARQAAMVALGVGAHLAVDELLIAAVKDSSRAMLLIGEPGCGQESLARVIHQVSHRRHNRFYELPVKPKLDHAVGEQVKESRNGTLLVHLHEDGKLEARTRDAITHPEARVRLIISAPSPAKAQASLPVELVSSAKQIRLTPLRARKAEIPDLLNDRFVASRSMLRFGTLPPAMQTGLQSHNWPNNLDELKSTADILVATAHCTSAREAAETANIPWRTFRRWRDKLGFAVNYPIVSR